jgi:hypothetical protein
LRIAHNEAQARRRQGLRIAPFDPARPETEAEMPDGRPGPDDVAEARELARLAETAIDALPDGLRSVLVLRGVQGLSTAEVGDAAPLDVGAQIGQQALVARVPLAGHQHPDHRRRGDGERQDPGCATHPSS